MGVVKFDSWVGPELADKHSLGLFFGAVGALAGYALDDSTETFAIDLQNASLALLNQRMSENNPNYINIDMMKKYSVAELTERFHSNRMWGMSDIKKQELQAFFNQNKSIKYALYIRSQTDLYLGKIVLNTTVSAYNRNLERIYKFKSKQKKTYEKPIIKRKTYESVSKQEKKEIRQQNVKKAFDIVIELQKKNIGAFLRDVGLTSS